MDTRWLSTLPPFDFGLNLNDPLTAILYGVFAILLALLLYLLYRVYRVLFVRPPEFGSWQPPYSLMPHIDPYSTAGMRQGWQMHAQNNIITAPPVQNNAHVIKRLMGADGVYLNGWHVKALRLSQYDQYGRVARSQTLADARSVKRLERLIRQRAKLTPAKAQARVKPIARRFARAFTRRISKRGAMLPIALDIRLSARHGEVSIVFELFTARDGVWSLVDRWQPDMMVLGRNIHEAYTYSVFGQTGGESWREFRARLNDDITRWLMVLLAVDAPPQSPAEPLKPQPRDLRPTAPLPPEPQASPPPSVYESDSPPTPAPQRTPKPIPPTAPHSPAVQSVPQDDVDSPA